MNLVRPIWKWGELGGRPTETAACWNFSHLPCGEVVWVWRDWRCLRWDQIIICYYTLVKSRPGSSDGLGYIHWPVRKKFGLGDVFYKFDLGYDVPPPRSPRGELINSYVPIEPHCLFPARPTEVFQSSSLEIQKPSKKRLSHGVLTDGSDGLDKQDRRMEDVSVILKIFTRFCFWTTGVNEYVVGDEFP